MFRKAKEMRVRLPSGLSQYLPAVVLSIIIACFSAAPAAARDLPRLLIINSYHPHFPWSDSEVAGILERMHEEYPEISLSIEYMDSIRHPGPQNVARFKGFLLDKYRETAMDILICLDNPALDMLIEHRDEIFPYVPVVFAGIGDFDPASLANHRRITGVLEMADFTGTIETALSFHPETRLVLVVADQTPSAIAARREVEAQIHRFEDRLDFSFLPPSTFDEAAAAIRSLPPDSITLLLPFNLDIEGRRVSPFESTRLLTEGISVPAYGHTDTRLGHGIVGGRLLGGRDHGRRAADYVIRILSGENPDAIPIDSSGTARPMFDYAQLRRFSISLKALPPESVVIGKPVSILESHREFVFASVAVVLSLSGLVVLLAVSVQRRRRVEERLRKSQGRYRLISENTADVIWTMDPGTDRYTYISPSVHRLLGFSSDEASQMTLRELLTDESYRNVRECVPENFGPRSVEDQSALIRTCFLDYYRKDGSVIPTEAVMTLLTDPRHRVIEILGVTRDITERRKAEQEKTRLEAQLAQAQKMESVGRLAGGVAHDFNNMLSVILGQVEILMMQSDPDGPVYARLREAHKAAKRSAELTRQLLGFARRQTITPRVIDLNETVESMLKILRRLIGEDIDLAWLPGKNLWPVKLDTSQIDQILANLCVNARDAISDVGRITIETENIELDNDYFSDRSEIVPGSYVRLAVSDDGCGMDRKMIENIFDPFFTTKEIGKGTGLGLATVYGIVKQNNGFINVYSEPGNGTTFKIYLPRNPETPVESTEQAAGEPLTGGNETVLLVEDEPMMLEIGQGMLETLGYRVLPAGSPAEAVRLAEEHRGEIHLLMTDVVMPEMNGRDLASELESIHPGTKFLFMSGYTANVIAHHGILEEGINFIQKPFSMKNLAAKIRQALAE